MAESSTEVQPWSMASIDASRVRTPADLRQHLREPCPLLSWASYHFRDVRSLITPTACQRPSRWNAETLSSTGISLAVPADRRQLHRPTEPRLPARRAREREDALR